ncbi:MAG TPA: hypothetical protein GXX74_03610 [Clostridiales bacterium]|nr:hypothetical protein [Clostridiales bacterium]
MWWVRTPVPAVRESLILSDKNVRSLSGSNQITGFPFRGTHRTQIDCSPLLWKFLVKRERIHHDEFSILGTGSAYRVPILLDELNRSGELKPGCLLALVAFGDGLTTGVCVIRWTKHETERIS